MEYNRGTMADYTFWHNKAMDAAGWTADEKINGKLDSFNFNKNTGVWDIPNTEVKTLRLFGWTQNPDSSDDCVFDKKTDTLTVLTKQERHDLMETWFPPELIP